jgi:hypothetical protein
MTQHGSSTTEMLTVTTGDGHGRCDCVLHKPAPACGISAVYMQVIRYPTTSVIQPGLVMELGVGA